jgi:menaquinone-dependent protoporphyrinogen oxidase
MHTTLIAYASRRGSTRSCAELIAQHIPGGADVVDLSKKQPDVQAYQKVVLGANAIIGKLNPRLIRFAKANQEPLKGKTVHLFMCCGENDPTVQEQIFTASLPPELLSQARSRVSLGGRLQAKGESFLLRLMLRMVGKVNDYDTIDPQGVISWAKSL